MPDNDDTDLPVLTEKQMNFVLAKQQGKNNSDAYRASYNVEGTPDKQIWVRASEVSSNSNVAVWLDYLKTARITEGVTESLYTKQRLLDDLADVAEAAKQNKAWSTYFKSIEAIGKAQGHFVAYSEAIVTTRKADNDLIEQIGKSLGPEAEKAARDRLALH